MRTLLRVLSSRLVVSGLLLAAIYGVLWGTFFSLRIVMTMEENEASYMRALRSARLCENSTIFEAMHTECEVSRARVGKTLRREALLKAWEASTLCGGTSCFALLFGASETVPSITLKLASLSLTIALMSYTTWKLALFISQKLGSSHPSTIVNVHKQLHRPGQRYQVNDIPEFRSKQHQQRPSASPQPTPPLPATITTPQDPAMMLKLRAIPISDEQ